MPGKKKLNAFVSTKHRCPGRIAVFENLLNLWSSADYFWNQHFRNTISVSNSLDSDQAGHFVRPDLGPNPFVKVISK